MENLTGRLAETDISPYAMTLAQFILPVLAIWVIARCMRSMLRERYEPEIWGYLVAPDGQEIPLHHWECIVGRSASADVSVWDNSVSSVHAALMRSSDGEWLAADLGSASGTYINGKRITEDTPALDGDVVSFGSVRFVFNDITERERSELESRRTPPGRFIGPGVTLFILTVFQSFLLLEFTINGQTEHLFSIALAFVALIVTEWCVYLMMRAIRRTGFEPETLAFFLTTLGLEVAATSTPGEMFKQTVIVLVGVGLFLVLGWWLRDLRRVKATRYAAAFAALGLLAVNVIFSEAVFGARNWLTVAGISLQPSEIVKVLFIYAGSATLDRLFARHNLIGFIGFSAVCVMALALIGDFGAAVIFFAVFLVMSFMRSGSFATLFLAVSGAGLAGFLAISLKPYIASRFASWGHVWDDVWGAGYQQTHALSASASGGLFGHGAGAGAFKDVFAANTDMVFGILCEELGLIVAVCALLAVLALAFFAVRNAALGRSTYYVIAGCAAVSLMLVQMSLNVFGTLDILPFTGVTFPFVSKGGTSLLSCWMLLSFVKASDTRRGASFSVSRTPDADQLPPEDEDENEAEDIQYDEGHISPPAPDAFEAAAETEADAAPYNKEDDLPDDEWFRELIDESRENGGDVESGESEDTKQ